MSNGRSVRELLWRQKPAPGDRRSAVAAGTSACATSFFESVFCVLRLGDGVETPDILVKVAGTNIRKRFAGIVELTQKVGARMIERGADGKRASRGADYLTGQIIAVDGGYTTTAVWPFEPEG
jgi:hypothetical protein